MKARRRVFWMGLATCFLGCAGGAVVLTHMLLPLFVAAKPAESAHGLGRLVCAATLILVGFVFMVHGAGNCPEG